MWTSVLSLLAGLVKFLNWLTGRQTQREIEQDIADDIVAENKRRVDEAAAARRDAESQWVPDADKPPVDH